MKILITGANGFIAKNLAIAFFQIKNKNDKRYFIDIDDIFLYTKNNTKEDLYRFLNEADFIFHFAGVNRPKDINEFKTGNFDLTKLIVDKLIEFNKKTPIVFASSKQVETKITDNNYAQTKLEAEKILLSYSEKTSANVYIYRFPNIFGKWAKPNYNSVIATFCYNLSRGMEIVVNDAKKVIEFLYIDDLVCDMINLFIYYFETKTNEVFHNNVIVEAPKKSISDYTYISTKSEFITLSEISEFLIKCSKTSINFNIPNIENKPFFKKLLSTYISYLPKEKVCVPLDMHIDNRGSFTEIIKTLGTGQFSVNISKPKIKKGIHFHNTKWEYFVVVKGKAIIRERKISISDFVDNGEINNKKYNDDEFLQYEVSGENIVAVHMLPGWTHEIINTSDTDELVTFMWANEQFDENNPDTYKEEI